MGNRRFFKMECLHMLGIPESKCLKVAALNLFHPTTSPLFQKVIFFMLRRNLGGGEGKGEGKRVQGTVLN
jgi:hypothetical protein